jgi:hypothetical protein
MTTTPSSSPPPLWQPTPHDLAAVLEWSRVEGLAWFAKRGAPVMEVAAVGLAGLRILPRRVFLDQYTTVVRHRAYAPWVDTPTASADERWGRIVTVVHEVQHWVQWQREPGLRFPVRYLLDERARARWEAEAYACNLELAAWRGGEQPSPIRMAERLREYGCGWAARGEAAALLVDASERARRGRWETEAVRRVLPLLASLRG